ncbi:MAG: hypothetical protein GW893_07170 [Armatimonadetes bacterium]|nr:hypothetical protein [Armatimonadota bacterium]PIX38542.1 MAG: hypothetical protein COZ56_20165 [Armatimonadetes bacterium CG_4_8_14_3_um_filter_58_9]
MSRRLLLYVIPFLWVGPACADLKSEKLLKPHAPMVVVNDEGFEDLAAQPGSGVTGGPGYDAQRPFVIENLKMQHDDTPAIQITGTTAHFVIRNVWTQGVVRKGMPSAAPGIEMVQVENGVVQDCRFEQDMGIGARMSYMIRFDRISIRMGRIMLYDTNRCIFTDFDIRDSVTQGIMIWHGKKNRFARCKALNIQREGIAFNGSCMDCEVLDCVFDHCVWAGISVECSPRIVMRGNEVAESRGYGIVLAYDSNDLVVEDNEVNYSGQDGIQLQTCKNANIIGNKVRNSGSAGIWFLGSESSTASNNVIEQANTGISVTGNKIGNVLEGNDISHCMNAIEIDGSKHVIRSNKIYANRNAINVKASFSTIEGNTFRDLINGINLNGSNNTVRRNSFEWMGVPLAVYEGSENGITDNTIKGFVFHGIHLAAGATRNAVTGNTLEGGRSSAGALTCEGATENRIEANTFEENPISINVTKSSNNNTITGNRIHRAGTGIIVVDSTGNTVTGNALSGCATPLSIFPKWMEKNKVEANEVRE